MTLPYRIAPAADLDLDRQADYLAREASLETALRFYDAARSTLEAIAQAPGIGERRDSRNPRLAGMRAWRVEGFPKHLIFYLVDEGGVEIACVLHGARDIDGVFDVD